MDRVVVAVVGTIIEVNNVDSMDSDTLKWNVVIDERLARLRDEHTSITKGVRRLPSDEPVSTLRSDRAARC